MKFIEVTCAIIVDSKKILATQRSATMPHPLKWEFPGGKLKEGETPESCIVREITEELDILIQVERLLPSVIHRYEDRAIKLIPFVCTRVEGTITLSEHQEYQWVSCEDLNRIDWLEADIEVVMMVKRALC